MIKPLRSWREGWARLATPFAGGDSGSWFLLDTQDEVLVAFEDGDRERGLAGHRSELHGARRADRTHDLDTTGDLEMRITCLPDDTPAETFVVPRPQLL